MEKLANLGNAAVLDADNMMVGQYVEIGGHMCVIDRIEGIQIYFRPLTTKETILLRWTRMHWLVKSLYVLGTGTVIASLCGIIWSLVK